MKDRGVERYKILFPIGMQFLTVGQCYEVFVQAGCREVYMLGDLDEIVGEGESVDWAPAGDSVEVERCQFRVIA